MFLYQSQHMLWLIFLFANMTTRFCVVQIDGAFFVGQIAKLTGIGLRAMIGSD